MKRQFIALGIIIATMFGVLNAQDIAPRKIHAGIGAKGGMGMLLLKPSEHTKLGLNGGVEFNLSYFFNETFGISAGIGGSYLQTGIYAENLLSTPEKEVSVRTAAGETMLRTRYEIKTPEVEETHKIMAIEIPVMFMLQGVPMDFSMERFHKCYFGVGVRMSMPMSYKVSSSYSVSKVSLGPELTGSGTTIDEPMPMGSYTPTDLSYDMKETVADNASSMMYVMATMEAGATIKFNSGKSMNVGIYGNYALNGTALNNDPESHLISTHGRGFTTVGYMNSNRVEKFRYFNFGLKIQYNIF